MMKRFVCCFAAFATVIFTVLFVACQSTGSGKRNSEAVLAYERGVSFFQSNEFEKAIVEYTRAVEIDPGYAEAYMQRAYTMGFSLDLNLKLIQEDYDAAAAIDPKLKNFATAIRYYIDKNYTEAIKVFSKVIKNKIYLPYAYNFRANSYASIGDYEKAIADNTKAIRLIPGFCGNYSNRAYCYLHTEQYDKAIEDCNKAIELHPDYFWVHIWRGETHLGLEDVEKALADINRAIELNPDNVGEDAYYPYLLSSSIHYFYTDEILKALSDINFAIELRSDVSEVFNLRGRINGALEKYDDAIADYSKSLSILPDDAYVLNLRGNVYSTMREYDDAIADFSRSISLVSDNANFYINRGYAYANRGYEGIAAGNLDDIRRALADIDTALKLDPENATTMRWRETLREVLDQ